MNIVSTTKSHPAKIALIAATILILELVFIRQLPAENHSLSYFTNLILMSSFFGLGIGCILEKKFNLERLLPIGLVAVFFFLIITRGMMVYQDTTLVHFWLQAVPGYESALKIPMFLCVVWAFISCLLPFIALGQYLIREMNQHSRLKAYSWDIIGSLIGTILFATASYFELPPWLLVTIVTLLASLLFIQQKWIQVTTSLAGLLFLYFFNTGLHAHWSPYYLVQHAQRTFGTSVWVNSSFHQYALDFVNPEPVSKKKTQYMLGKFSTPYNIYKEMHSGNTPETVLVLGAGTGNDLNIALLNEAKKITAVEIDPAIQRLGTKINTLKPYSDPKVTAIIDDARHFLRTSKEKFDLIVFGTLDSQTLLSGVANLRLENFVYTKESFEAAKSLLNDKGMVVVYYSALKPWLLSRIYTTMREVFGEQLRFLRMNDAFLFNSIIIAGNNLSELKDDPVNIKEFANNIPLSDNWPYLYLEKATIAPIYQSLFLVLLGLVIISFFVLRKVEPATGWHFNFLFLGIGFTLMESAAIVRLALLFGSTWIVNAVVFSAVLLMIYLANLTVMYGKAASLKSSWLLLFIAIFLNYLIPVSSLTGLSLELRYLTSGLLIGIPVFAAASCFSHLFDKQKSTAYPLGINLIGAMSGGMIEYLSMAIGMQAIWLVVVGVYGLAWITSRVKGTR